MPRQQSKDNYQQTNTAQDGPCQISHIAFAFTVLHDDIVLHGDGYIT